MADEYRIACIADFLAVPADKQGECLRDFATWLEMARNAEIVDALFTEALGGKITFSTKYFNWCDDGIAGVTSVDLRDEGSDRVMRLDIQEQSC